MTEAGYTTVLEAYNGWLFENIFKDIVVPNGYKKMYRISAYVSTTSTAKAGIAINNKLFFQDQTWSGATYRYLDYTDFFELSSIPVQKLTHYDGTGYNMQMYYEGGGTANIYHATVHGYLVREE